MRSERFEEIAKIWWRAVRREEKEIWRILGPFAADYSQRKPVVDLFGELHVVLAFAKMLSAQPWVRAGYRIWWESPVGRKFCDIVLAPKHGGGSKLYLEVKYAFGGGVAVIQSAAGS
jgi:hypothetical protein